MTRFKDFDIKIQRSDYPSGEFRAKLKTIRSEAHRFLRTAYPGIDHLKKIQDARSLGFWYTENHPISIACTGDIEAFSIDKMSMASIQERGYWDLRAEASERGFDPDAMVEEITAMADKDLILNPLSFENPNFRDFAIPWPEKFSRCEVNDIVRISKFDFEKRELSIQKATYLDSCITNLRSDEPLNFAGGKTFRELNTQNGMLAPLNKSPLANGLGVACIFMDRNGVILFNDRRESDKQSRPMAIMKAGLHASSSGVLEWSDICRADGSVDQISFAHGIIRGMAREISRECGLAAEGTEGVTYEIAALQFARELPRAGKPQIFFIAKFNCSAADLEDLVKRRRQSQQLAPEGNEYGNYFERVKVAKIELTTDLIPHLTFEGYGAYQALIDTDLDAVRWRRASDFSTALDSGQLKNM